MSGTSLDGIDLVFAKFEKDLSWTFSILATETFEYNTFWKSELKNLVDYSVDELNRIDHNYTVYLSDVINAFIKKYNITQLDAICSHGHTALHQPEKKLTYQIGNKSILSKLTNNTVVCDFRVQDVALGGQGAPLVPIGDELLFSHLLYHEKT